MRWDLTRSSLGDSPKESGSLLGMRREIVGKKTEGLTARLSEVAGAIVGPPIPQNPGGSQQVLVGKPPRRRLDRPYHRLRAMANG
ncbi:hypothetical protein BHE74_00052411 [Ensete ventricosum]|nr:hypothetical protein BHE74_00052411 [Ensete ventricosum]